MRRPNISIKVKLLLILMALFLLSIPTSSQIDNCCFVDRQCNTDEQWISGWWAYQNNQCAAADHSQLQQQHPGQQRRSPSEIDNCCYIGWQCDADGDWKSGYFAFQHGQCDSSQSHWQEQWRQRQSAETAAARNSNQQRKSGNQQWKSGNQQQQQQQSSNQAPGPIDLNYKSKRVTYLPDGTPVVVVSLGWQEFNRMWCSFYPDHHPCS